MPLFALGDWLRTTPLPPASAIQVTLRRGAEGFVLPWSLLFDGDATTKDPGSLLEGFWGTRYNVEQQLERHRLDTSAPPAGAVRTALMLWRQFHNAPSHTKFWQNLQSRSDGRLHVSDAVVSARAFIDSVAQDPYQVLYFYSHGYTRSRREDVASEHALQRLPQLIATVSPETDMQALFTRVYEKVVEERAKNEDSYIELTRGRLYLADLYRELTRLKGRPLVFLNMCESAQVTPSLSESFVQFFLDRGARCVIGTECLMTTKFADIFAEAFFEGLFAGKSVGEALLEVRRKFAKRGNPLALAYTLFGSASLCYQPPCVQTTTQRIDQEDLS